MRDLDKTWIRDLEKGLGPHPEERAVARVSKDGRRARPLPLFVALHGTGSASALRRRRNSIGPALVRGHHGRILLRRATHGGRLFWPAKGGLRGNRMRQGECAEDHNKRCPYYCSVFHRRVLSCDIANRKLARISGKAISMAAAPCASRYPARKDHSNAITATAIRAVPIQPSATSQGLALNLPISSKLVTTTIIIAMIGTATMPLSTALHTSM
jgi:hypothetical protein